MARNSMTRRSSTSAADTSIMLLMKRLQLFAGCRPAPVAGRYDGLGCDALSWRSAFAVATFVVVDTVWPR